MNDFINVLQEFAFNLAIAILPVIAGFVVAALNALTKKWLADLENAKPKLYWFIDNAVELAVRAAEQSHLAGFIDDKKAYAVKIAQDYLDAEGWEEIDVSLLEAAVEAEVLKQFPKEEEGEE